MNRWRRTFSSRCSDLKCGRRSPWNCNRPPHQHRPGGTPSKASTISIFTSTDSVAGRVDTTPVLTAYYFTRFFKFEFDFRFVFYSSCFIRLEICWIFLGDVMIRWWYWTWHLFSFDLFYYNSYLIIMIGIIINAHYYSYRWIGNMYRWNQELK